MTIVALKIAFIVLGDYNHFCLLMELTSNGHLIRNDLIKEFLHHVRTANDRIEFNAM